MRTLTFIIRLFVLPLLIQFGFMHASAQQTVTIGSEALNEKAVLMLLTPGGNQGLILPVVSNKTAVNATAQEKGMIVFDDADDKVYLWNGASWIDLANGGSVSVTSLNEVGDVNTTGAATGQVLKWNGSAWAPAIDETGTGGGGTDNQTLIFNNETRILTIVGGNTVDLSSLTGVGDNWGTQAVEKDNTLKGEGTTTSPLGLAQQGATTNQVLKWNGTDWLPANDNVAGGGGAVNTNARLSGDGSAGSPLDIAQQGAGNGQVLKWNGTQWSPAVDETGSGGRTYTAGAGISISGANEISNVGDADNDPTNEVDVTSKTGLLSGNGAVVSGLVGTVNGQVAKWNAGSNAWEAGTDATGEGSSTDDQNLVLTGDVLSIEGGTGSVDLNIYRNDADSDPTNEIDVTTMTGLLTGNGTEVSGLVGTADGQVAKWNAGASIWEAGTDATAGGSSLWNEIPSGDGISYNAGFVGIETSTPTAKLDVNGDIRTRALSGTGERNVVADADGNLVIGAGSSGSSLWTESDDDIYYNDGDVGIGTIVPAVEPGAGKYLTLSPGGATSLNQFPSLELQGHSGTGDPTIGRIDFISNSAPGNSAIARIASRKANNTQFNGDMSFYTKGGTPYSASSLEERMTIKYNGNVGIGTTNPVARLDLKGGQWDLTNTEGDFRVGNDAIRLKVGVSLGGGGAGIVRMRAQGGTVQELRLGAGTSDVIIVKEDAVVVDGEVNRPSTGSANMIPIAYGLVNRDGTTRNGTNNFTVTKSSGNGKYLISVNGEILGLNTHIMVLTALADYGAVASYVIFGEDYYVNTRTLDNLEFDISFSFVIYKM